MRKFLITILLITLPLLTFAQSNIIALSVKADDEFTCDLTAVADGTKITIEGGSFLVNGEEVSEITIDSKKTGVTIKASAETVKLNGDIQVFGYDLNKLSDPTTTVQLTGFDAAGHTVLESIRVRKNAITKLNLNNCTALEKVEAAKNALTEVLIAGTTNLNTLYLTDNSELTEISLNGSPKLAKLKIEKTGISSIDISKNPKITWLYLEATNVTEVDLSNLEELQIISFTNCKNIKHVNFTANLEMTTVTLTGSSIETVEFANEPYDELTAFRAAGSALTALNPPYGEKLHTIDVAETQMTTEELNKLFVALKPAVSARGRSLFLLDEQENTQWEEIVAKTTIGFLQGKEWTPMKKQKTVLENTFFTGNAYYLYLEQPAHGTITALIGTEETTESKFVGINNQIKVTFTPEDGYPLDKFYYNGVEIPENGKMITIQAGTNLYHFSATTICTKKMNIVVEAPDCVAVSLLDESNEPIDYKEGITVGTMVKVVIDVDKEKGIIRESTINDEPIPETLIKIEDIAGGYTIKVAVDLYIFAELAEVKNGKITIMRGQEEVTAETKLLPGDVLSITIEPDENYELEKVTIGEEESKELVFDYTIPKDATQLPIAVTLKKKTGITDDQDENNEDPLDAQTPVHSALLAEVSAAPNPFNTALRIVNATDVLHFAIYNAQGQIIHNAAHNGNATIELTGLNLPQGIYFIRLKARDGERVLRLMRE